MPVGVRIEVDHLKAVPVGATVIVFSKLVEIDGRRLIFEVEARSGADVIGRGRIFSQGRRALSLCCHRRRKTRIALNAQGSPIRILFQEFGITTSRRSAAALPCAEAAG